MSGSPREQYLNTTLLQPYVTDLRHYRRDYGVATQRSRPSVNVTLIVNVILRPAAYIEIYVVLQSAVLFLNSNGISLTTTSNIKYPTVCYLPLCTIAAYDLYLIVNSEILAAHLTTLC